MNMQEIADAAHILSGAQHVVALTGAGISTPSGIPDFRGNEGLWTREDPMEVASLRGFRRDPQRFYRWFQPLLEPILSATPNPAHYALAELEQAGKLRALITQNIDGLHQRAGSRAVYELHGHLRSATCVTCEHQAPSGHVLETARKGKSPRCQCGGHYKPDVVLFDEALPRGLFWLAQYEMEQCDALVIAGTALEVFPVSDLPHSALRRGTPMIIVNKGPTHLDEQAAVIIREDVATALPAILKQMERAVAR